MVGKPWLERVQGLELWIVVTVIILLVLILIRSSGSLVEHTKSYKAEQLKTSFASALRLLHSSWLVAGKPQQVTNFKAYGDGQFNLNSAGWPVSVSGNSVSSTVTEDGCREVFAALLQDDKSSAGNTLPPMIKVSAVSTVCVYQFGHSRQDYSSLLYNAESGELQITRHQRTE